MITCIHTACAAAAGILPSHVISRSGNLKKFRPSLALEATTPISPKMGPRSVGIGTRLLFYIGSLRTARINDC